MDNRASPHGSKLLSVGGRLSHFGDLKPCALLCFLLFSLNALAVAARGELVIPPEREPQLIFADVAQHVPVAFRNETGSRQILSISIRIFQVSSSTLMPLDKALSWKQIELLPGQTVLESALVKLPPVKVATTFQIHWLGEDGRVFSKTPLIGVPKDIVRSLSEITSNEEAGLLDPENRIKPLFTEQRIAFQDLNDEDGLARYGGRLAILLLPPDPERWKRIAELVEKKAASGTAVIVAGLEGASWNSVAPVQIIRSAGAEVIVVDPRLFRDLATSPKAQLTLIRLAALVLNPQKPPLLALP